ncbi:putative integral membrane protein [Babesia bovis T2Bo]|uniref:putative integral membrane protein n=1 Tax=Babesia bovis T2Bo TaxID=484906 RepID=UPI001D2085A0|nr:putative integral membrane protein [Babesia bovis T2Bo]KAG6439895.1 putative integral membrane protein [Babesia bovis T2Bo]
MHFILQCELHCVIMRPIGLQLGSCYSAVLAIMNNSWSLLVFVLFLTYCDVNSIIIGVNVGNSLRQQHTSSICYCPVAFTASIRRDVNAKHASYDLRSIRINV